MENQHSLPRIRFTISGEIPSCLTTMLQCGILVPAIAGESLGVFFSRLPGFTADYLAETVQTIFLDGSAIDDLTTPLPAADCVVALSAAMPGLAGAIFRKNSFHAALRSDLQRSHTQKKKKADRDITVKLKLFNNIARQRGVEMFLYGVVIETRSLVTHLVKNPQLTAQMQQMTLGDMVIDPQRIAQSITSYPLCHLQLDRIHGKQYQTT